MKARAWLAVGVFLTIFVLFFFFAPIVWMNIIPCLLHRDGYASLSYYLFNIGATYLNGHFTWFTQNYSKCI